MCQKLGPNYRSLCVGAIIVTAMSLALCFVHCACATVTFAFCVCGKLVLMSRSLFACLSKEDYCIHCTSRAWVETTILLKNSDQQVPGFLQACGEATMQVLS